MMELLHVPLERKKVMKELFACMLGDDVGKGVASSVRCIGYIVNLFEKVLLASMVAVVSLKEHFPSICVRDQD